MSEEKIGDRFGVGIILGSIWGSFRGWGSFWGRGHFRGCTVSETKETLAQTSDDPFVSAYYD